jgi:PAS domain S-box-containing protein
MQAESLMDQTPSHLNNEHVSALLSAATAESRWRGWARLMTLGALLLGLGLTALMATSMATKNREDTQAAFDQQTERVRRELLRRFQTPEEGLRAMRSMLIAQKFKVDRQTFGTYVSTIDLARQYPGVLGFGLIERVPRAHLGSFEARERADQGEGFTVKSSGEHPDLFVIKWIEPIDNNLPAWGYDVGSETHRREATERAIRTGEPTLTRRINLTQDRKKRAGFLFELAVYDAGGAVPPPDKRLSLLRCVVYTPILLDELMSGMKDVTRDLIAFDLIDPDPGKPVLMYSNHGHATSPPPGSLSTTMDVTVAGLKMRLEMRPTARFNSLIARSTHLWVACVGILLSGLLSATIWLLTTRRAQAEAHARAVTTELDRLAVVAKHTSNAVIITDRLLRITWVNSGFTRTYGYTLDEALGHTPGQLLASGRSEPSAIRTLIESARKGVGCRVEVINRTKEGLERWMDIEVQPTVSAQGDVNGFIEIGLDVTDQKAANFKLAAALRESKTLLRLINTHYLVSVADAKGKIIDANPAFCRVSGYALKDLLGQDHRIINSGVQNKAFWQNMWHTVSRGEVWRAEICNRARDGHLYWVDSIIAPFLGEDGKVQRYVSVRTDITRSKLAAQEIEQQRSSLNNILEGTNAGTWECNVRTGEAKVNARWASILGFELSELEPVTIATWRQHVLKEDLAHSDALLERYYKGSSDLYDCELRMRHREGHIVWVHVRGRVWSWLSPGRPDWMGGIMLDITERKRAEVELSGTMALLRAVLDSASEVSVIATDPEFRITVFNRGAERLLGCAAVDMIGRCTPLDIHDPRELTQRATELSLAHRREFSTIQALTDPITRGMPSEWTYVRRDDGSKVRVSQVITAMLAQDGSLIGYVSTAHDITQQLAYEDSLESAMQRAEAANVAKGQFLANMSHEIRSPMNAILGMLTLLKKTQLAPHQRDYTVKTESAARSLLSLLNDILDFSKIEAGKMELDPRWFSLDSLLNDLSVILSANIGPKNVHVLYDIDPTTPDRLYGDDMRLQQVLINLAGNAIKFTQTGEVVIGIRPISVLADWCQLHVSIRDTGIGIAPENQARIFEGFSQAEASTSRRFGGTGLGLGICQRLVSLMDGHIEVQSTPGQGSHFHFTISIKREAQTPAEPVSGQVQLLVIDPNAASRQLVEQMARHQGWHAMLASQPSEAAHALAQNDTWTSNAMTVVLVDADFLGESDPQTWVTHISPELSSANLVAMARSKESLLSLDRFLHSGNPLGLLSKPFTPGMLTAQVRALASRRAGDSTWTPPAADQQRLSGIHLLVAEDNPNNQQIAFELLSGEGAKVTLAADGQACVLTLFHAPTHTFDLVLMDLQMPTMDGYTAAGLIRADARFKDLPIIAMTANVMEPDRTQALAAGMNDHIGKPFDLDPLINAICRWSKRQPVIDDPSTAKPPTERPTSPSPTRTTRASDPALDALIDDAQGRGLDLRSALTRMAYRVDVYERMARNFMTDARSMPAHFRQALADNNLAHARLLAHTVKGLGSTLGCQALHDTAKACEAALNTAMATTDTDTDTLSQQLEQQILQAANLADFVAGRLSALSGKSPGNSPATGQDSASPEALRATLLHLQLLLQRSDMQALDVHAHLVQMAPPPWQAALQAMDEPLQKLDFARVCDQCESLLAEQAPAG